MSEDVIIERIDNLKEFFKEEFRQNKEEHNSIRGKMQKQADDHEERIRQLEDWKLIFVAKYSVYSAIALFVGSMVATLLINLVGRYI